MQSGSTQSGAFRPELDVEVNELVVPTYALLQKRLESLAGYANGKPFARGAEQSA
jgi:hypothetical protein